MGKDRYPVFREFILDYFATIANFSNESGISERLIVDLIEGRYQNDQSKEWKLKDDIEGALVSLNISVSDWQYIWALDLLKASTTYLKVGDRTLKINHLIVVEELGPFKLTDINQ